MQKAGRLDAVRRASGGTQHFHMLAAVTLVVMLLYGVSKYSQSHQPGRTSLLLPARGSAGTSSIAQQLLSLLSQGPDAQLLQQHILPLTNISSLSLAQLPLLLQGTNLTLLSTADVLDSAAADGIGWQQKWKLVNLHQQLHCTAGLTHQAGSLPNHVLAPQGNFSTYVYAEHDFVSKELAGPRHSYEHSEVEQVLWAMQQHSQAQPGSASAAAALMVDAGANVGAFLFRAADAGYRVAAFEGMPANIALLRASLCANPRLAKTVALFGLALGSIEGTCYTVSDQINVGDGHTVCGEEEVRKRTLNTGYTIRGTAAVRRLDSIVSEDVQVLKLDVEGFELQVLEGAALLLTKHRVNYILAACTFGGAPRQRKMLKFLDELGYLVSLDSFKGPWLEPAAVVNGTSRLPWNNIFCARKELAQSPPVQH
ncbi:S-adenosyl-L-methionine-dependent methyltransferase [Scenedesmus sp. NREL 46B-D3]|nr:S-adenosyl-L-methionine-dependent methyltransferase [Scenedesmus sp. NREL 46B-D3]